MIPNVLRVLDSYIASLEAQLRTAAQEKAALVERNTFVRLGS